MALPRGTCWEEAFSVNLIKSGNNNFRFQVDAGKVRFRQGRLLVNKDEALMKLVDVVAGKSLKPKKAKEPAKDKEAQTK